MSQPRKSNPQSDKYETCVCCQKRLRVLRETPVALRDWYIEGCGQLCEQCYMDVLLHEDEEYELTREQMAYLVEISRRK